MILKKLRNQKEIFLPVAWALITLFIAWKRSLWCDEWNHVQDLKNGVLWAARELLHKPSPFTPGEQIFNGFFKLLLEPMGVPLEIWARLQGIFWGASAVWLCTKLEKKNLGFRWLTGFVFFSAALTSYATEMRPYASLYFSGALLLKIFVDQGIKDKGTAILTVFLIAFGHIYALCFVAFLLTVINFKKYFPVVLAAALVVCGTLLLMNIVKNQGGGGFPTVWDILGQIAGTTVNPHRAAWVVAPLFFVVTTGWKGLLKTPRLQYQYLALILATLVAPVLATILGKYFFVPRQCAASSVLILAPLSLSIEGLWNAYKDYIQTRRVILLTLILYASVVSWLITSVLKIPPFPSQPFHRFKQVAEQTVSSSVKNILVLDPCNASVIFDYINLAQKVPPAKDVQGFAPGFDIAARTVCWKKENTEQCFVIINDLKFCSYTFASMESLPWIQSLQKRSFDVLWHGYQQPVTWGTALVLRDW